MSRLAFAWARMAQPLAVLRAAWLTRRELQPPRLSRHEAEFLPAVLAVRDTPPSPLPRAIAALCCGTLAVAVIWACLGRIDVIATATGEVIASGRNKLIQPVDGGVVRQLLVREGQSVRAGDVLIVLDAATAEADLARAREEWNSARLEQRRQSWLLAVVDDETKTLPVPPAWPEDIDVSRRAAEDARATSQAQEYRSQLAQARAQVVQHRAERASISAEIGKLEASLPITRQRTQALREMAERKFVAQRDYLDAEQRHVEQSHDLAIAQRRLAEADAAVAAAERNVDAVRAQARKRFDEALGVAATQARSLEQEVAKADVRGRQTRLLAPVDGTVQQLAVHTLGGVVTPAQVLMTIVPADATIEIDAVIENKDIGFVHEGQSAEIKVDTFTFTKYGTLHGTVTGIARDAVRDERRGLVYTARVSLDGASVVVDGEPQAVAPGMAVSVEIKITRRRIIEYFLAPLLEHARGALRER